jgi:two-component system, NarL family, nitrate/nitrite response regulator NarL
VYLDAVCRAVQQAGDLALAGRANDGDEAVAVIGELRPDVAVLDIEMPGRTGPQVAAELVRLEIPTRVLFLSARHDGATVYDALAVGGFGYVTKDAPLRDVVDAIRRVATGVRSLGSTIEHDVLAELQSGGAPDASLELTDREREVLERAVNGMTIVAMGKELHLSSATVRVHLSTVYAKLGVEDRASAVAEAIRRGLVV